MEKIGLLGGTFNPVHNGHLHAAETVKKKMGLDRILFIPSHIPPHKKNGEIVSSAHRWTMIELALAPLPGMEASSVEIDAPGTSYSVLTLKRVSEAYPDSALFFILGTDAFRDIKTWKDHEKVLARISFIVMSRPGCGLEEAAGILGDEEKHRIVDLSEGKEAERIQSGSWVYLLPIAALPISSTVIRKRLGEGKSIQGMVPDSVAEYIQKHRLYQGET